MEQKHDVAIAGGGHVGLPLAVALAALLVAGLNSAVLVTGRPVNASVLDRAYGPQPDRTAEWAGEQDGPMPQEAIDASLPVCMGEKLPDRRAVCDNLAE